MRILLVDDDRDVRELLGDYLRKKGYEVDEAEDGVVGLHKFRHGEYDAVVSDYQMPRKNGIIFLQDVRRLEPATRLILQTASYGLGELMDRAGLADVPLLHKPYRMHEVVDLLEPRSRAEAI